MNLQIEVFSAGEAERHFHARILAKLQQRFEETKRKNPAGFLDQFEQQCENHCVEVAQELGGIAELEQTAATLVVRFNFTHQPLEVLQVLADTP